MSRIDWIGSILIIWSCAICDSVRPNGNLSRNRRLENKLLGFRIIFQIVHILACMRRFIRVSIRCPQSLNDMLSREPFVRRGEIPAHNAQDCNGAKDHAREIEGIGCDRKVKGADVRRKHDRIEKNCRSIEWLRKFAQVEPRRPEVIWGHC